MKFQTKLLDVEAQQVNDIDKITLIELDHIGNTYFFWDHQLCEYRRVLRGDWLIRWGNGRVSVMTDEIFNYTFTKDKL